MPAKGIDSVHSGSMSPWAAPAAQRPVGNRVVVQLIAEAIDAKAYTVGEDTVLNGTSDDEPRGTRPVR